MKTSELKSAKAKASKISKDLQAIRESLANSGNINLITKADEAQVAVTRLVSFLTGTLNARESVEKAFINLTSNKPQR